MNQDPILHDPAALSPEEIVEPVDFRFSVDRRLFVQLLGSGLLLTISAEFALGQRSGRAASSSAPVSGRIHLGKDGIITVLTGKVEGGQGARAELTMAAAEELRVAVERVQMLMADTSQVPDDGSTAGSRTTPATVPAVRRAAAAARELMLDFACKQWSVDRSAAEWREGCLREKGGSRKLDYADLASNAEALKALDLPATSVSLTPVADWKVLGKPTQRPNARDLVTGAHRFPSDIVRPGMLYGKVLRPSSYGAKLLEVDLSPAKSMPGVVAVRDDQFVGVAAPNSLQAREALAAVAATAKWDKPAHPASEDVFAYLRDHAQNGVPSNPFTEELAQAKQVLKATYLMPYVQHAPLEPRAAVAEWTEGVLTVWAGTQNPFGHKSELVRAFRLPEEKVRVVVPDFGGGFGGKHTGEASVEAARLAQAAGRPVSLRWTREEEFTWAYFRPAAVIEVEASLADNGTISSWHYVNINSGSAALETPYRCKNRSRFINSSSPVRQGSYRALAAPANTFARESFMDELATAAGLDPLEFRLRHLEDGRLKAVLEAAAERFGWKEKVKRKDPAKGIGLACGTEKGSYVAACVEAHIDPKDNIISVTRVCEVFECGPVLNPSNLLSQVQGQIMMALGPALREEIVFEDGVVQNASFRRYHVPRFSDLPEMDISFLERNDLDPAGGGETPIIPVAPAIANAVYHATGKRLRKLPLQVPV